MTNIRIATLAALLIGFAATASAQAVKLEFHDGKVNLTTQNASTRAILAEWARLGGTQVVNADRITGAPVTLQLTDVPETQALDIILRGNAGYIAGQRAGAGPVGNRSALDRIMLISTAGTAGVAAARPVNSPPPFAVVQPRQVQPPPDPDDDPVSDEPPDDDAPQPRRNQQFNPPTRPGAPQPSQVPDDDDDAAKQPTNTTAPANPFGIQSGSSRPGTISPVPQQPNQQGPRQIPDPEP